MELERNPEDCYGCASCVLACSFHHEGEFSPSLSSISVFKDDKTGDINWSVDNSCDFCQGEDEPFCVRFCPYDALRMVNSSE